uniref:Ubiquitin-like modifier-activating enzyme ATG7 n=1 Tax=Plectus sambesii TaxID=2011161 RepID=A0A914VB73_9BILA
VKFVPFASFVDPAFWADLTDRKLRHWGLDDSAKLCVAGFVNHDPPGVPCRLSLDYQAFNNDVQTTGGTRKVIGHLLLTNTVEEFRNIDRKALMHKFGDEIWSEIVQRRWMREPSVLNRFLLTVFANLKKFHYYYWLCAPALCFPANIRLLKPSKPFDDKELAQKCVKFSQDNRTAAYAFLIVRQASKEAELKPLTSLADPSVNIDEVTLVFADPSTQEAFPGWPLRNLLAALAYEKPQWNHVNVVCLRQRFVDGQLDTSHSVVLDIGWDGMKELKA